MFYLMTHSTHFIYSYVTSDTQDIDTIHEHTIKMITYCVKIIIMKQKSKPENACNEFFLRP